MFGRNQQEPAIGSSGIKPEPEKVDRSAFPPGWDFRLDGSTPPARIEVPRFQIQLSERPTGDGWEAEIVDRLGYYEERLGRVYGRTRDDALAAARELCDEREGPASPPDPAELVEYGPTVTVWDL